MLQEHFRKEDSGALGFSLILHFKNFSFDTLTKTNAYN